MRALLLVLLFALSPPAARADQAAWDALASGGHVALMRHATAPGGGDPAGFRVDDCATQRNLNDEGRREAGAAGAAFRERGIRVDAVLSSQWCRCLETARLMDVGEVQPFPPLNSFFGDRSAGPERVAGVRQRVAEWRASDPRGALLMVTHQVTITALTGIFPRSGEIIVAKPGPDGALTVVGRIPPG